MRSTSFNTDKGTKHKLAVLAGIMLTSQERIIREAIRTFASEIDDDTSRSQGCTVSLDDELVTKIQAAAERTGLSKSLIIHKCLQKYLQAHANKIIDFAAKQGVAA
jgi:predicted transcriptional regulator